MAEKNDELVITRTFDVPGELVWKAWIEDMDQWSALKGFAIPKSEGDLRPGGKRHATMVTPEGKELGLGGVYREIVPPESCRRLERVLRQARGAARGESLIATRRRPLVDEGDVA